MEQQRLSERSPILPFHRFLRIPLSWLLKRIPYPPVKVWSTCNSLSSIGMTKPCYVPWAKSVKFMCALEDWRKDTWTLKPLQRNFWQTGLPHLHLARILYAYRSTDFPGLKHGIGKEFVTGCIVLGILVVTTLMALWNALGGQTTRSRSEGSESSSERSTLISAST